MQSCDYFERLISRQIDDDLTTDELTALQRHCETCAGCRTYADTVQRQQGLLRRLPELVSDAPGDGRSRSRGWARLWQKRISVPLPLAAGIVLLLAGITASGWFLPAGDTDNNLEGDGVTYVRVERLEPVSAQPVTNLPENDTGQETRP